MIIQGGMGAGVSNWKLARAVSLEGHLGVVSGTALDTILARRLQLGDPGGHMERALANFPNGEIARRVLSKYYIPEGKQPAAPFKPVPMFGLKPSTALLELALAANFAEVWLAKEGHDGVVGINFLEKIQMPNLVSIYGAMLAGVDYVLMGAGIPTEIPPVLDRYVNHEEARLRPNMESRGDEPRALRFNPVDVMGSMSSPLRRPQFLAIISSVVLAKTLVKKCKGGVNGFVIEGPAAGGHNAPPRGGGEINEKGEPVYGEKDVVDLEAIKKLGLPFWLAGSFGEPERVKEATAMGAAGVQAGTAFMLCEESGLSREIKTAIIEKLLAGEIDVFTDPKASPTGFPFKIFRMEGTLSDRDAYEIRPRVCDLGYLRTAVEDSEGRVLYRCPAEPEKDYVRKGGDEKDTAGRMCLCNALMANIGLATPRGDGHEQPLVTSGDNLKSVMRFLKNGRKRFTAADVLEYLCSMVRAERAALAESEA